MLEGGAEQGSAWGAAFAVGAVLVCAGWAASGLAVALARRWFPGRNVFFARWRFAHVGLVVAAYLCLSVLAGLVLAAWTGASGEAFVTSGDSAELPTELVLLASVFVNAGVAAVVWRVANALDPDGWRSLGLRGARNARAIVVGLCAYVLTFPGYVGLGILWPALLQKFGVAHEAQEVLADIAELDGPALALAFALGGVVIPFFEELLFRGFLQPLLVQNLGDRGGVVVTSLVFASLHGTSAFLPIFGLSLVLGSLMLRTQRLAAPALVHALHNTLMIALVVLAPEASELMGT